ncbi:nucleotidyltransferase family protein [Pseudoduganella chitinolytica]|uniref:Nucleotidyltransferase family protein n=1 Tax=Pseudoduganella chitinolytica TaxID=34070 RepID=A0ABY8BC34_9BURK|nr:nucleotidyltransferase family protein [Pseudoduganella chitinolytica]WEF32733.1 nucleotidyltransferase family protein [Pseudoduganella chitinolytica]
MADVVGILLAAGRGRRFDPQGQRNKLLQPLADGDVVAAASARHLLAALPRVIAVVRADDDATAALLAGAGCEVTRCADADTGMAASLVHGLRAAPQAAGWVVALADMPRVQPATIAALRQAVAEGADIAAPVHQGKRGNPVAFGRRHLPELLALSGDRGARGIVSNHPVNEVCVDDAGILLDIDTPTDL